MKTAVCQFCGKKTDAFIMFRGAVVGCKYCGIHTKQTNADRIRAMTDEELLFFLWWFADGSGKTKDQWLDWLKQESEA